MARLRAAELVLRSGAFGLVIIEAPLGDISSYSSTLPARALSRLHAMARRHDSRVVFRRPREERTSMGPLVGLQLRAQRDIDDRSTICFELRKNKVGTVETPSWEVRWPEGAHPNTSTLDHLASARVENTKTEPQLTLLPVQQVG